MDQQDEKEFDMFTTEDDFGNFRLIVLICILTLLFLNEGLSASLL